MVMVMTVISILISVIVLDLHWHEPTSPVPRWLRRLAFGFMVISTDFQLKWGFRLPQRVLSYMACIGFSVGQFFHGINKTVQRSCLGKQDTKNSCDSVFHFYFHSESRLSTFIFARMFKKIQGLKHKKALFLKHIPLKTLWYIVFVLPFLGKGLSLICRFDVS